MRAQIEHIIRRPDGSRKATPVLLLHGAWHGAWCYDLWLDDFAAHGYETHVMSLPAHGKSGRSRPLNLYGVSDYVAALKQIIDQIEPRPFVIGHSMGGFVVQQNLLRYKDAPLPGAVLLATMPVFGALPFNLRYFSHHPLRFLWAVGTGRTGLMVRTPELTAECFLTEGSALSPETICARLQNESLRAALELGAFFWRRGPQRITTPVLVVAAERDAVFPVREEEFTARAYGAEFMLISDQGHDLQVERDWRQVAERIRVWFERIMIDK